jgi:hypothetical protein
MKKAILLLMAAMMIIPTAEAKRRESEEEIERKTRHYQGWEWGAEARLDLVFYDMTYSKVLNDPAVMSYKAQAKFGGNVMLNGGYFINNNWRLGLELGAQMQYNYTVMPVAVTARYFYGTRKNCLFNFVNVGTNVLFNNGMRFGALGEGGVGVRLQSPESKLKYDIILGYQALMLNPRPHGGDFTLPNSKVKFKKLNQSVYLGFGISF